MLFGCVVLQMDGADRMQLIGPTLKEGGDETLVVKGQEEEEQQQQQVQAQEEVAVVLGLRAIVSVQEGVAIMMQTYLHQ